MLEVVIAPADSKETVWELYQEYAQELSQYDGEKRRRGSYHYPYFDLYWEEEKRTPFLILYDHEPIGFCLLQDIDISYQIDEFYIRPLHRRRGFGKLAVEHVKEYCRKLGRHKTIIANVYVNNRTAIEFWRSAGFRDTGRRIRVKDLRLIETEADLSC
jgi:predicted acetyltransferase